MVLQLPVMVFAAAQIGRWRVDELHHCLLSTAQGLTLNSIATNLLKYAAGRYRPNWYVVVAAAWCYVERSHVLRRAL